MQSVLGVTVSMAYYICIFFIHIAFLWQGLASEQQNRSVCVPTCQGAGEWATYHYFSTSFPVFNESVMSSHVTMEGGTASMSQKHALHVEASNSLIGQEIRQ
jgi:hypothetical protein